MLFFHAMFRRKSKPTTTLDGAEDRDTPLGTDEHRGHRILDEDDLEILDRQLFSEDAEAVDRRKDPLRR